VPRILLDENIPIALKRLLTGHKVATVKEMGWKGIQNGALLALAQQSGFEILITGDKNLSYQQNPAGRTIALVVLSETQWQAVRSGSDRILKALMEIAAGSCRVVVLDRPELVRRPPPNRLDND
jgi:predicted nuclease of predicted toxin-antitoxin system